MFGPNFKPLKCERCNITAIKVMKVFFEGKEQEVCKKCKKEIMALKEEMLKDSGVLFG